MRIVTTENKKDEKFLRTPTKIFDFPKYDKKTIRELIKTMRTAMKAANGVGLSANQISLDIKVFVAQVNNKWYGIFNPTIEKPSTENLEAEEGCLSIPGTYGLVPRSSRLTLNGFDQNGKKIKIKAWGLLARVFQHEVDHLNGKLFIDKARSIQKIIPKKSDGK